MKSSQREMRALLRRKCRSSESLALYMRVLDDIGTLTRAGVQSWYDRIGADGLSPNSIRTYCAVARSILAARAEEGDGEAASALRWFKRSVSLPLANNVSILPPTHQRRGEGEDQRGATQ